ncbi:kinase-like domain-containing protein [Rhizophagus irregularis DAOM 181602=DAOM 197198]|nr:kinase-like domain-containing protein [Rhizophagus irregularis DAOM 181602=DAOM 197198]
MVKSVPAKGGFGTTFKAVWKEGPISNWNFDNNQWERHGGVKEVALKCLHNSQGITAEFLKEVESNSLSSSSSSTAQLPLSSTSTLSYIAHTQAVYISKLLDFKNLPEPKNADNDNLEYSDSVRIDFTKLNITSNSKDE